MQALAGAEDFDLSELIAGRAFRPLGESPRHAERACLPGEVESMRMSGVRDDQDQFEGDPQAQRRLIPGRESPLHIVCADAITFF